MSDARCPECNGYRGLPRILNPDDNPRECSNIFHSTPAPVEAEPDQVPGPPPPIEMPKPQEPAAPSQVVGLPVCPFCGIEGQIRGKTIQLGPFKVLVIMCGNNDCRKILGAFQPLEITTMQPPGAPN